MHPQSVKKTKEDFTWRELLAQRCSHLLDLRSQVLRRGDEEAYHDLRVATRRLQELVAFLNPFLPQRRARRVWRRARKIRRSVSETRNADVMRALITGLTPRLAPDQARCLTQLATCVPKPRRRRPPNLPEAGKRLVSLKARFVEPARGGVTMRAEQLLTERLTRLQNARKKARRGSPQSMHRLRIAVKHYRYLLELLAPMGLEGAQAALKRARVTQHSLGKLHDLDMLQESLSRNGSSKAVRDVLSRERRRRLKEARQDLQTLPSIEIRWRRLSVRGGK